MPNSYFQFNQFTIHQDRCAMKVCTDACMLGAWFAEKVPPWSFVLDIGSGTGLLMLMLAQKLSGEIIGIELDLGSFTQLRENIAQSPWKDRLKAYPGDIRSFVFPDKFDFIISNPPFFEGDLATASDSKNLARHSKELRLAELIQVIDTNLKHSGSFGILLPFHRMAYFVELAAGHAFHLQEKLLVRQSPQHDYFRAILHFSRSKENFVPFGELSIKNQEGEYSQEFVELMKDYYLHL
jgi:tRNA1Val (adenine37-N6)-methyltransferase